MKTANQISVEAPAGANICTINYDLVIMVPRILSYLLISRNLEPCLVI